MSITEVSPPQPQVRAPSPAVPAPTTAQRSVTLAFVALPPVALLVAVTQVWSSSITALDAAIAVVMYVIVGFGITVGYHRMLTHRSFRPSRALKIVMAVAGSMAFEGGPIRWVADHRRHHAFSDRSGDPHSPQPLDSGHGRMRGLVHAQFGWLFRHTPTPQDQYAHDLIEDRDIARIDRLFPAWCGVSLAIPFVLGYVIGGGLPSALSAVLWAGGVRVFLQHHVTWSINSICHTTGSRPFETKDRSGNVAALAVASFGESWHNGHHALPRSARHGVLPHQWDSSALLIRWFERLGWATAVVWPTPKQLARARGRRETVGSRPPDRDHDRIPIAPA